MVRKDFFISYNHTDENWATWLAFTLEQKGYSSVIQAWDFRPGSNFALEMDKAAKEAERTIAVLSPDYLKSEFAAPEWAAAFTSDPTGAKNALIPVRVRSCDIQGLLGQIVYIDLVGLDDEAATAKLVGGINPSRAKPLTKPDFPGEESSSEGSRFSEGGPAEPILDWQVLPSPLPVAWRPTQRDSYEPTTIELHLVPFEPIRVESRRLAVLSDELIALGRQHGLFTPSQGVDAKTSDEAVIVSARTRNEGQTGLMVTRGGQRSAWLTLPHDSLGSVLDAADIGGRVNALLDLLMTLDLPSSASVGFAAAVTPVQMMMVGDAGTVGHRSRASMPMTSSPGIKVEADDIISLETARGASSQIAEEVVARVMAKAQR